MTNQLIENFMFVRERDKTFDKYQMVPELTLSFMISGRKELRFVDEVIHGHSGSTALIRKNELLKSIQMSDENGELYESISIFFTPEIIRSYAASNNISPHGKFKGKPYVDLTGSKFIRAYFESLIPYFVQPQKLTSKIAALKTQEAIELLLDFDIKIEQLIFDLSEPFKIDLEKFMNKNFIFNVPIKEFARLTGRSLSTFKRDFKNIYNSTPEKWIKEKRLVEAKFLITEKQQRPSEVCYNVGFENLAHFSTAFKERFGESPSKI
ncbi:helix-turn-helix domain-containing protein [Flavobacterium notoginsengisoli]|uniref:helix-turn-helix domain-containing protein n=1 Tax=Flavobacterium notoginsengisoli TaxID=1478199 RepID=UPI003639C0F8